MDLKNFTPKAIQGLSRTSNIQRWYNVLHSSGRVCGVYTVPWERFSKISVMGDTWNSKSLDQVVLDRKDLMSEALHCLLSSQGMFSGDCAEFSNLISTSFRDGYLALYQIVRLVHPLLGQFTAKPAQPQQKRNQPFSEHILLYIDCFQSETCPSRLYSLNERIILILSRLHLVWRDVMKRKYMQLVPQHGTITFIPLAVVRRGTFGISLLAFSPRFPRLRTHRHHG
jgi:hypothetical protein